MLIAVVAAVVILVVGILVGAYLRGTSSSPTYDPALASDSLSSAVPSPTPSVEDSIGVSDPEVAAWHKDLSPVIGGIYQVMTARAPDNEQDVRLTCERLNLSMEALRKAPEAPKGDLEKAYRSWVSALDSAVAMCLEGPNGVPSQEWVQEVNAAIAATGTQFDSFGQTLDLYFDFSAVPQG